MNEQTGMTNEDFMSQELERLAFALDTAGVGFWDLDVTTNEQYYSSGIYTILDFEVGGFEANLDTWAEMLHPDDREEAQQKVAEYLAGKTPEYLSEYRMKKKDGSYAWIESKGQIAERGDDGAPLRMIGTHVDISDRKAEEKARIENEQRAALALETASAGYWDVNVVTNEVYLNPAFYTILGYEVGEFPPSVESWASLLHPEDAETAQNAFQDFVSGAREDYTLEFRMKKKDGSWLWMESRGTVTDRAEDGTITRVLGVQIDINERKSVIEQMVMMESAVATATMGIAIFDLEGKAQIINDAFYDILGYDAEINELVGATVTHSVTEEGARIMQEEIMPTVMAKEGWRGDMQLYRKDGDLIDIDSSFAPVLDEGGNIIAISGMATDITEQREIEMALQEQNQAMMEMSTPVITLWDEIVMLPLVGTIDDDRAMQMTERLLEAIVGYEARVAILDVTGVAVIDTSVARNLLKAVDAASMLGARVVVTGFSPSAAQTLAQLGVDFSSLMTQGSLRAGIAQAFALVGQHIVDKYETHS